MSAGGSHVSTAWALVARPARFTGAAAGELGMAVAMLDVAPLPADVTALTRKRIVTPLSRPVNV